MFDDFDAQDQQNSPVSFKPVATTSGNPELQGYKTPAQLALEGELADRSTLAAAFRTTNLVISGIANAGWRTDNTDDGKFDPVEYVKQNGLEGHEDSFMGVLNQRRADVIKADIEQQQRDRQTLAASGVPGWFAQLAAGTFDAPLLIPGMTVSRAAVGGWTVGKGALEGAMGAGAFMAASEAGLHVSQPERTWEESAHNVEAGIVLGSLLGGAAGLLSAHEAVKVEKTLEEINKIQTGEKPNPPILPTDTSAGAMEAGVDPIMAPRTVEETAVSGKTGKVAAATSWLNPMLRSTQRYAASARQFGANIYESTFYRSMHDVGDTMGAAVESSWRTAVESGMDKAMTGSEAAYKAMRSEGIRMSRDDFYNEIGKAMRNSDQHDVPFVAQGAKSFRELFDQPTKTALQLGLLKDTDLDLSTAPSYLMRLYDKDRLLAQEPQFLDVIGKHYALKMKSEHASDEATRDAETARLEQRIEDLQTTGAERTARIEAVKQQGDTLETNYADIADARDAIAEQRLIAREAEGDAKIEARRRVQQMVKEAGPRLQEYYQKRADLRARHQALTTGADALEVRAARSRQRIDELQEIGQKSVAATGKQIKNILNQIAKDPTLSAHEALNNATAQLMKVSRLLEASAKRVERLTADVPAGEQPAGLKAYWEARKAEQAALREKVAATSDQIDKLATLSPEELKAALLESARANRAAREQNFGKAAEKATGAKENLLDVQDAVPFQLAELNDLLDSVARQSADRLMRAGEERGRLKAKLKDLGPEQIKKQAESRVAQVKDALAKVQERYQRRWMAREALAEELGRPEAYPFEAAGRATAKEVYDKLTGKVQQRDDVPPFLTKITAGPMKDRTFLVPDEMLVRNGWLVNDVREIAARYSRAMHGEIELTRRFGRADMQDQLSQVAKEYSDMRVKADQATTIEELNAALGRPRFSARKTLDKAKLEAQQLLAKDEKGAIEDIKAGRDLIRGTYNQGANSGMMGTVSRNLMHFNYIRAMGGVLIPNLADFYRPAMVHGLMPYLRALPDAIAQAFGKGSEGLKLSIEEAKRAGLIHERLTLSNLAANGDLADPFVNKATALERLMQKGSALASRWNGLAMAIDAQQTIASTVSQHRIIQAILDKASEPGSFVPVGQGERLIRMLGIDRATQKDIAELIGQYGKEVDGLMIPNTEDWLRNAAGADLGTQMRVEKAVRAYRTAVNMDVNSVVSRRGIGDVPLLANHPLGKLLTQFMGFTFGAHSRVMLRGMQEDTTRFISGLTVLTAMGSMASVLAALRGGRERFDKYMASITKNPGILIGDGLDRSGVFPLMFEFANRMEKLTGGMGYDYRVNPIKSPIIAAGGGSPVGVVTNRASDSSGVLSSLLGPSAGIIDSGLAAGRVVSDVARGKPPTQHDKNTAVSILPYNSYLGARELLQYMMGNSPYARQ